MFKSPPRFVRVLTLALASSVILMGCAGLTSLLEPTERVDVNAVACGAFQPIRWSPADTDDTLKQIHEHNAAWRVLCGDRAAP